MTLDEAIAHAKEVAERNRKQYKNCPSDRTDIRYQTCEECAKQHEQLAEWLEELKELRELKSKLDINSQYRLYRIWQMMRQRCNNENAENYKYYGGRGICVCDEWENDFSLFALWSFANGYNDNLTIDRIESNGNYEPSNCRWISKKEQTNNRSSNTKYTYDGETHGKEETYGFDALVNEIDSIICWQEWSRCGYEMGVCYKFETDCKNIMHMDCYEQAHMNIEVIAREVVRQYKEQKKKAKDGE